MVLARFFHRLEYEGLRRHDKHSLEDGEVLVCGKCGAIKMAFDEFRTKKTRRTTTWENPEEYRWVMNHILPKEVKDKIPCIDTK